MSHDVELEGLEVLTSEECLVLLARSRVGRVGFVVAAQPRVLPVNFSAAPDGAVVFRTTPTSILTAVDGQPAAFETDGYLEHQRTGWSVCVHGVGREITDDDDPAARQLQQLTVITWAPGRRDRWFTITPDEITGRRLPLTIAPSDFGWFAGVVS
jgi:nitroimidazol reductase NimA-like FMN-containing flavoprotein (pyridoxamine 5'-phosphate oxidase superfamily)